ncbi:MAG: energy transducer TonB [Pseudomonadota bacterium]
MESLKEARALGAIVLMLALAGAHADDTVLVSGPGVEYWTPTFRAQPDYPRSAALRGTVGCAVVQFVVEADGRTSSHRVLFSEPPKVFDREAVDALKRWRFEPGPDNPDGQAALLTQTLNFELVGRERVRCTTADAAATDVQ